MKNIAIPIARIAATTATIPIRSTTAVSSATANILGWEWRQFTCSRLSAEGRRERRYYRELIETHNDIQTHNDTAGMGNPKQRSKQQAHPNGTPHARSRRQAEPA